MSQISTDTMDLELLGNNSSPLTNPEDNDALFHVCWRRQSCLNCLAGDVPCSWCAISSTCVPNTARVPIFAPIGLETICPLGSKERWELRALPLGCHASTLTVLSVMIAVLGTVAFGGVLFGIVWLVQRVRRRWKETEYGRASDRKSGHEGHSGGLGIGLFLAFWPGKGHRMEIEDGDEAETRPLLE
ncbi:hypothetical protein N7508_006640 [Penicillium antarcticum]|uniref:uncharacterized protein n=1 Tax=Penicillium antarcticum TaxID=416450 RepID=UPI00239D700D|nr:uncharacterized protein N7508_006640 [Penicillium antarcticum]KAJ5301777.1 hypothetical protein N7508_006640 [Penicillium antarcticum]